MAKIYNTPSAIKVPEMDFSNFNIDKYNQECNKFKEDLKKLVQKRKPNGECVGEIIQFPVADGYAEYMIASIKPVELIHLPLSDAWHFQYANRITASDIKAQIKLQKALIKIFS